MTKKLNLAFALVFIALLAGCAHQQFPTTASQTLRLAEGASWKKLETAAYRGKQDDIFFINADVGWYVNGGGKIYKTIDSGKTWVEKLSQPGTYFRTIGFIDDKRGFAGNIGTDYFPNVTDTTPLYQTEDGGDTWKPVKEGVTGPVVKGLCAIDILKQRYINAGVLEERTLIHAAGRVGGPAFMLRSLDGGKTWKSMDLSNVAGMILDVKFFDANTGFIFAASDSDTEKSNALILMTRDGGVTWTEQYRSKRPFEITWKASFPSRQVGYVTVQNYNPDKTVTQRVVAKTVDGGISWKELPLADDVAVREFGVGFASNDIGWVGTSTSGFQTLDGGQNWQRVEMGRAVNKIRIVNTPQGFVGYAIGTEVHRLQSEKP